MGYGQGKQSNNVPVPKKEINAKLVKERYESGLKATLHERRDYWINYAFLRGRQWVYWNRVTKRIDDVARVRGRYQATIDRLSPSSGTLMAKLTERELTFEVPPSGADDDSIMGSRTAEAILQQLKRDHDWETLREDYAWAIWVGGTAAICVDWDPQAGDQLPDTDENGDSIFTGDICETVLTIPEFVIEPGARIAERARWWIKSIILPPETVQSMWPKHFDKIPPSDSQSSNSPYNQRVITADDQAMNMVDGTIVMTYYERPNALNPTGCVAVVVDNKIVEKRDWPFPWTDRLNLVVSTETKVNGRWTGETMLSKACKVQTAYNAAWSNYLEHLKKVGNARLLVPASQMEMGDALTDDPGKPLKFMDGNNLPQYLQPPQLPAWVRDIISDLRSEMDTITGVTEVMRGQTPSNAPDSGYGFQILDTNSSTPIGRIAKEMARAWGKIGSFALRLYAENIEDTHKAVINMPKQPPMTVPWTGKSLAGQTTAIVPVEAILPRNRAAAEKRAELLVQMGFIQPGDVVSFARIAELDNPADVIEATDYQTALAIRYCHYMAEGHMIEPKPWHNSQVMINEINRFRCSPRYEQLHPELQELFEIAAQAYDTLAKEQAGQRKAEQDLNPLIATTPDKNGAPHFTNISRWSTCRRTDASTYARIRRSTTYALSRRIN
jgi:hypothetical protein